MSKRMSRYPSDRKVYVGDLGNNARKNELEYAFSAYGTLRSVWIARNPPGFAFVEFEDARDAADSVRGLDGRTICGRRVRVELSTGKLAGSGRDRRGSGRNRPFNPDDKCYECGGRGHYARDCRRRRTSRRRSRSRSRSRSYSRDRRTRSRTGSRSDRTRSRSRSRSRSKSSRNESRIKSSNRSNERRSSRENANGISEVPHSGDESPQRGRSSGRGDRDESSSKRRYNSSRSKSRSRRSRSTSRNRDSRSRSRTGRNAD